MTGISTVFALVMLFSLGACDDWEYQKAASFPKLVSIVMDKCDQMERMLKDATLVYPMLIKTDDALLTGLDKFSIKMDYVRSNLFRDSGEYKGRKYSYFSELYDFDVSSAEAACNMLGGYLAEVTDDGEYDFVKRFLKNETNSEDEVFVVIAGTDEGVEQLWKLPRSGERMTFLPWVVNGPGPADCLAIMTHEEFKFMSVECAQAEVRYGFLCEIEP
ncbi:unnamed protein product [Lymnaea stagnalis]|uniref:C-type lectin domain-containing protein n=1 Tax=Lymnaea stagnalis TaxID=6523 RepID=A0AAV2IIG0_LYMST